jgi:hypothetical protein
MPSLRARSKAREPLLLLITTQTRAEISPALQPSMIACKSEPPPDAKTAMFFTLT